MKRPFFCVALAYALGEVTALYTRTAGEISIAIVVLIFAGMIGLKRKQKGVWLLVAGICTGMLCAFLCIPAEVRDNREYERIVSVEDAYAVETYAAQKEQHGQEQSCTGVLVDIHGDTWTVRVLTEKTEDGHKKVAFKSAGMTKYILLRGMEEEDCHGMNRYKISDVIRITGIYHAFDNPSNPGAFPAKTYYLARNITGYYYAPQTVCLRKDQNLLKQPYRMYYTWKSQLYMAREKMNAQLYHILPSEIASIVSGILLGDKSEIDPETKRLYQIGGIAHILAISGLHISLLGGCLFRLLRKFRVPIGAAGITAMILVFTYGILTGMSLATIRAVWMLIIQLVAQILGKPYDMPTSMGIALLFMLLVNPVRILDSGMQLSYMAIAGVLLGNYVVRRLHRKTAFRRFQKRCRLRYRIVQSVIYSITLNAMMLPVLAKSYYVISVYAWLLNLIVIPLMTVVVVSAWIGLLLSGISLAWGGFLALPARWVLQFYTWLCRWTLMIPGNTIHTGEIMPVQMFMWYGMIVILFVLLHTGTRNKIRDKWYRRTGQFWRKKQVIRYNVIVCMAMIFLLFGGQVFFAGSQRTEAVYFLDVGQGDGILIRTPKGKNIVIDGGSTTQPKCGIYTILPAIRSQGIAQIDCWFVTHTDEDHISGLREIVELGKLSQIKVCAVVFSAYMVRDKAYYELETLLRKNGVAIHYMNAGEYIGDGTFTFTCLHPTRSYQPADKNAASLALAYHSNAFDMLFTGDMDMDAVEDMLGIDDWRAVDGAGIDGSGGQVPWQSTDGMEYNCVKLPHHGSKYSYSENLYARTKYAVISCGKKNRYGHPHAEVLEGLKQAGVQVLRTDEMGAVIFRSR